MKLLYAAGNNSNAAVQLFRFTQAIQELPIQCKVAAFQKSSSLNLNIDWTLNALLNIFDPTFFSLESDNLSIYFDQVKSFSPDLIISDLEYFTSYIGDVLHIPVWQCSSSLINYGLHRQQKYNLGVFKYYAHSLYADERLTERIYSILNRSDKNLVYSHFGDLPDTPILVDNFHWVRPYHKVGKISKPCQHNFVAGLLEHNIKVLDILSRYPYSVVFLPSAMSNYQNLIIKDLYQEEEYFCNLHNSFGLMSQGQTSFLADAFYNGKYSLVIPNFTEPETLMNSCISSALGLSSNVNNCEDIEACYDKKIEPTYNDVKYLHQMIMEVI